MRFRCDWVKVANDDDAFEALGVRWTEARWFCEAVLLIGAALMFGGGAFMLLGGVAVGLLGILAGVGLYYVAMYFPGSPREIVFWQDGRMETPLGLSTNFLWPGNRWLDHLGIKSIEIEQLVTGQGDDKSVYSHGVRIFYECGEMNHVAKNLGPDQAHMLAVRLNRARLTMKDQMQRPETAAPANGRRVID